MDDIFKDLKPQQIEYVELVCGKVLNRDELQVRFGKRGLQLLEENLNVRKAIQEFKVYKSALKKQRESFKAEKWDELEVRAMEIMAASMDGPDGKLAQDAAKFVLSGKKAYKEALGKIVAEKDQNVDSRTIVIKSDPFADKKNG